MKRILIHAKSLAGEWMTYRDANWDVPMFAKVEAAKKYAEARVYPFRIVERGGEDCNAHVIERMLHNAVLRGCDLSRSFLSADLDDPISSTDNNRYDRSDLRQRANWDLP